MTTQPSNSPESPVSPKGKSFAGRWKWAAGILTIAIVAQATLWTLWWDDPTHFAMSVLFVWPAALFALFLWWMFFSGWSWAVRLGTVAAGVAIFVAVIARYRFEWDGSMIPRRMVLRSIPSSEEVAREFFKNKAAASGSTEQPAAEPAPLELAAGDWPGFRGPNRDGIVRGITLRSNWDEVPLREVWRHPVGRGWSSFSIVGTHAFTQEQRDLDECVVAYDLETGNELWIHRDRALLSIVDANGGPGPHGTPQFDDGLLYTLGGTGILNCLQAVNGKPVWSAEILKDAGDGKTPVKPPEWGVSNSPLIVGDLVIVIAGGAPENSQSPSDKGIAAYDKKTGKPVWAKGRHPASYGSARWETLAETPQILAPTGDGLVSVSPDDGRELWFFPLENGPHVNATMPWHLDDDSLIFGTGYGIGTAQIKPEKSGDSWAVAKLGMSARFRPKFNDFVYRDGYIYGLDDGRLACLDVKNMNDRKGGIMWVAGRYGYGQLLLMDDRLLVLSEEGELMLIPATPKKPEVQVSVKLFHTGFCWNHLALVPGRLLARNANEAVCLELSGPTEVTDAAR